MYRKVTTIEETFGDNPPQSNEEDIIKVDVPLMIGLLEFAREDSKSDLDLHVMTENMVSLSESGKVLTMDCYSKIIEKPTKPK